MQKIDELNTPFNRPVDDEMTPKPLHSPATDLDQTWMGEVKQCASVWTWLKPCESIFNGVDKPQCHFEA